MNVSMKHSLVAAGALAFLLATAVGAAAQGVPGAPPDTHGGEATLVFQPGDDSPYSADYDWRLIEKYPLMTGTLWTDNVHVGRDLSDATEHRLVVNAPDIVGNEPGQVPVGAMIKKATIQLLANQAQNVPVAVRALLEQNLGEAGRTLGKAECTAPGWQFRTYDTSWSQPGAGWPLSSAATPLDTRTVTQNYTWVEFDITGAMQSWALDPASNHGLLFAAADLSVPGQSFKGGCAEDQHRPIVTVTFLDVADLVGPALEITTPVSSHCLSAFVEGTCGPDAVNVEMTVNGEPYTVERASNTRWHCEVPLQAEGPTVVRVVARDALGNETTAGQHLRWAPVDPFASDSLLLAVGDMIRMKVNAPGPLVKWVEYDAGDGGSTNFQLPGAPSFPIWYTEPGSYQARATLYDAQLVPLCQDEVTITVVGVASNAPIVAQAGYLREVAFDVLPQSATSKVFLSAGDPSRLFLGAQTAVNGSIAATLAHLGNDAQDAALELRLGGPEGRIIAARAVHPFYIEHQPLAADGSSQFDFTVRVVPHTVLEIAPQLQFEVRLLSNGAAFPAALDPDGDERIMVGTDKFDHGWLTLPASQDWSLSSQFIRDITGYDFPGSGAVFVAPPGAGTPVTVPMKKSGANQPNWTVGIEGPDSLLLSTEKVTYTAVPSGLDPPDSIKCLWYCDPPVPSKNKNESTYEPVFKWARQYNLSVRATSQSHGVQWGYMTVQVYTKVVVKHTGNAPMLDPATPEKISLDYPVRGTALPFTWLQPNDVFTLTPKFEAEYDDVLKQAIKVEEKLTNEVQGPMVPRSLKLSYKYPFKGLQEGEHKIALYAQKRFDVRTGSFELYQDNGVLKVGTYKVYTAAGPYPGPLWTKDDLNYAVNVQVVPAPGGGP
ncbi:MAG: hypothetical protein HY812_18670 [Planctomycetes bacterium]|nr:hypothetical protein [Planctomycetota bacterium]